MKIYNFGQNVSIAPNAVYRPESEQEILEILARHEGCRIRCIGRLHSWSKVLDADEVLLDLRNLNSVQLESCDKTPIARVGAGCQIKKLLRELETQGNKTLPSVGFVTEQTIAGAISTGTHGSGRHSLSHYVTKVRVARYDRATGTPVIEEICGGAELRAARCALGSLGVIVAVTIQCRENYLVEESFREHLTLDSVLEAEEEFPLQQFYLIPWRWTFFGQHRRESTNGKSILFSLNQWYRFLTIDILMHLLIILSVRFIRLNILVRFLFRRCLSAFVIRNWKASGPANRQLVMEHELFRHIETEIFVHRKQLGSAVDFVKKTMMFMETTTGELDQDFSRQLEKAGLVDELQSLRGTYCHHFPICVRKVLPDDTLISMSASADGKATPVDENESWYAISLISFQRGRSREGFQGFAAFITGAMIKIFGARPHWGKICQAPASELVRQYPSFEKFRRICDEADPKKVFRNNWTSELLNSGFKSSKNAATR